MSLRLFVPSPFAYLALDSTGNVFNLAFHLIFVHDISSSIWNVGVAARD
jgi:hypothetical protein